MYQYMQPTVLPQQQILQANGKASIDALRLAPNSSVLIADQTAPIIWKCVSDSLGNVSATAYDVIPRKTESEIEKENLMNTLKDIADRLTRLENKHESVTVKPTNTSATSNQANANNDAKFPKSTGFAAANGKQ